MLAIPDVITRGATVVWEVIFTNQLGDPMLPDSAMLYISYKHSRRVVEQQIPMALQSDGITWLATWESANADAGQLDWHIRSADTYTAALQGAFRIDINKANPATAFTLSAAPLTGGSPMIGP